MPQRNFFALPLAAFTLSTSIVPAFAHSRPKTMLPAANATVSSPAEVSVYFTEPLEPKFSSLKLIDQKGETVNKASSTLDPIDHTHLLLPLPPLASGAYHVHWVSVANDGHRMEGDYTFTIK